VKVKSESDCATYNEGITGSDHTMEVKVKVVIQWKWKWEWLYTKVTGIIQWKRRWKWLNEWMKVCKWMQMCKWMIDRMSGWLDREVNGRMDGWTDGWVEINERDLTACLAEEPVKWTWVFWEELLRARWARLAVKWFDWFSYFCFWPNTQISIWIGVVVYR
jgi:hypothetical protein